MVNEIYVGIDPGLSGGWAVIDQTGTPVLMAKFENYLDFKVEIEGLSRHHKVALVVLEQVSAMPGQGVTSMFTFGSNFGGWKATLELMQLPHILVRPQAWQKDILGSFPKGESKKKAYDYIVRLYPKYDIKKSQTGIVDALCLALYGRKNK